VLNARLAEIAGNSALTPAQQAQGLRLAILATAFRQPDFNSTEKHFGPLRSVATVMANDILRSLGASHAESAATTALRQGRHDRSLSARDSSLESAASPAQESIAATFPMAGRTANRSAATTGFFAMPSYAASDPAALPLSTLAAAGIQGISPAVLALGTGALALGGNDSHRPSYYVEETTAADSDTHSGSQQDSSRQGQEERPSQEQATAYLA
jgi:hypothetical protein